MQKKRYRPEDIIAKLREADILISQGKTVAETIKHLGVSDVTYYRWRKDGWYDNYPGEAAQRTGERKPETS